MVCNLYSQLFLVNSSEYKTPLAQIKAAVRLSKNKGILLAATKLLVKIVLRIKTPVFYNKLKPKQGPEKLNAPQGHAIHDRVSLNTIIDK